MLSAWAGLRPVIEDKSKSTASTPRSHEIRKSDSHLVTILGGKWTTSRAAAEEAVDYTISLRQVGGGGAAAVFVAHSRCRSV